MHLMQIDLLGEIREADMLNINRRWPERVHKLAELLLKRGEMEGIIPGKEKAIEGYRSHKCGHPKLCNLKDVKGYKKLAI